MTDAQLIDMILDSGAPAPELPAPAPAAKIVDEAA
jgi:hypothetical protein